MFGKFVLVMWCVLAAAASYASAADMPLRGGWMCKSSPSLELSLKVNVRYVSASKPFTEDGHYRMQVTADGQQILHSEDAELGTEPDRYVFKAQGETASAELMIANVEKGGATNGTPSLLYISRVQQSFDSRIPIASVIDLVCTQTRTE